ncbi:hypothetical protein Dimus_018423, partial [Dionaea muscipula]
MEKTLAARSHGGNQQPEAIARNPDDDGGGTPPILPRSIALRAKGAVVFTRNDR